MEERWSHWEKTPPFTFATTASPFVALFLYNRRLLSKLTRDWLLTEYVTRCIGGSLVYTKSQQTLLKVLELNKYGTPDWFDFKEYCGQAK